MAMHDVLAFCPGTIVEFSKSVEEELDLMINNKCIGGGVAVKVGENFGLKVTRIGSLRQTIKALGGGDSHAEGESSAPTGENSIESQESIDALFNSVT
jgi:flagellar motor switch protein FliN/FliY